MNKWTFGSRHIIGGAVISWAATRHNTTMDLMVGCVLFLIFAIGEYVAVWYAPKSWDVIGEKDDNISDWITSKSGLKTEVKEIDSKMQNAFAWKDASTTRVAITKGLREQLTTEELKAILSHEVGHIKMKHPKRLMTNSILFDLSGLIGSWFFIKWWSDTMPAFNPEKIDATYWIWLAPWAILILAFIASREWIYFLRRKYELEADQVALNYTSADLTKRALAAIYSKHESDDGGFFKFGETHPKMAKRLKRLG